MYMSPNSLVWKRFRVIHLKFYRNCTFPQNLRTRKSGEITVFYAAEIIIHENSRALFKRSHFKKRGNREDARAIENCP